MPSLTHYGLPKWTCPLIDEVIVVLKYQDSIHNDRSIGEAIHIMEAIGEAIHIMEAIRDANKDLRDIATNYIHKCEQLEEENNELKQRIAELELQINSL